MHIHIFEYLIFEKRMNHMLEPVQFFKCLSDETRLYAMLLILVEGELCVCELMEAMNNSQPKISRHLAQLRNCGLLDDARRGQWVFYSLAKNLPKWAKNVLDTICNAHSESLSVYQKNLKSMKYRPQCC